MKMEHYYPEKQHLSGQSIWFLSHDVRHLFFLNPRPLHKVSSRVSFALFYNAKGKKLPVDLKSPISVIHLIHITGPLHDVLEGSLTRDIIHQEDSLRREIKALKKKQQKNR